VNFTALSPVILPRLPRFYYLFQFPFQLLEQGEWVEHEKSTNRAFLGAYDPLFDPWTAAGAVTHVHGGLLIASQLLTIWIIGTTVTSVQAVCTLP
jgi:hypothetical protein